MSQAMLNMKALNSRAYSNEVLTGAIGSAVTGAYNSLPSETLLPSGSANLMVDKDDRKAMLLRLFNEKEVDIINHVAEKARAEKQSKDEKEEEDDDEEETLKADVDMADAEEGGVAVDMDGDA